MIFLVVTMIIVLFTDTSLSADPQFNLPAFNDSGAQGMQTIAIKGIAKYKPGGSAMLLSLLVQGEPGIMPGASAPGGGPSGSPTPSGGGGSSAPSPTGGSTGTKGQGAGSTAPSPTGGSSGGSFQKFETDALDAHNKFRAVHGSQPMKLNREMCDEAAAYAKIIAQSGSLQHSSREQRKGQGENLSMGCHSNKPEPQTTVEATNGWYNEVCSPGYEFSRGRGQGGTGHFTQVVWNDSVELGIGKADGTKGRMKCTYIVGRYKPLGNFFTGNEDYKKNVKQGSFNRQAYCSSIKKTQGFKKSSSSVLNMILKRK